MANEAIKTAAKSAGVKLWEIADYVGVVDSTFSRQLRREFPEDKKQRIMEAIRAIADQKRGTRSCQECGR